MPTAPDGKTPKQRIADSMKVLNITLAKRKAIAGNAFKRKIQNSVDGLNASIAADKSVDTKNKVTYEVKQVRKPFSFEYHDGKDADPSKT